MGVVGELLASLNRVFQPLVENKPVKLIFNIEESIPSHIFCDSTRTTQVLTNLVNNAVKFTQEGQIQVDVSLVEQDGEHVSLKFSVNDSGIGIAEDKMASIFQSFTQASSSTTRQFGGTGLGLSITKQLLELQGSDLHVESEVGVGSTFYFTQSFVVDKSERVEEIPIVRAKEEQG